METISYDQVPDMVEQLREFLTQESIDKATETLWETERQSGFIARRRLGELQPWLYGFEEYDRLSSDTKHPFWTMSVLRLAQAGRFIGSVLGRMPENIQKHHRTAMLSTRASLTPFLAEWSSAHAYAVMGETTVEWGEPGAGAADFTVHCPQGLFQVECKHFTGMIAEYLPDREADTLAEQLLKTIYDAQWHGEIRVVVENRAAPASGLWTRQLLHWLETRPDSRPVPLLVPPLRFQGRLRRRSGATLEEKPMEQLLDNQIPGYRSYLCAGEKDSKLLDPLRVFIKGPRRSPAELRDYIYDRLDRSAEQQFCKTIGGVLVIEFANIREASAFHTPGIRSILTKLLLKHRHIAAVVLRSAARFAEEMRGSANITQDAYLIRSPYTTFPEIAGTAHIL